MKNLSLAIIALAFALTGCKSAPTPHDAVPANEITLSLTNGVLHVSNPKSNKIVGMDIKADAKNGTYSFHADSIEDAMDPNVITMSADGYAAMTKANSDAFNSGIDHVTTGIGGVLGATAGTAVKTVK